MTKQKNENRGKELAQAIEKKPATEQTIGPKKLTKEEKQALSGKGKTRVQIAQEVVDKLTAQLEEAKKRLELAKEQAKTPKKDDAEFKRLLKARDTLLKNGLMQEADAVQTKIEELNV